MGRLIFLFLPCLCFADSDVVKKAEVARQQISVTEKETRAVLRELYALQVRVKEISKSRSRLNDQMLSSDGDAQTLAQSVSVWQTKMEQERKALTKRLGLLYRWNSPSLLPLVFSSESASEFEKNMRYLKRFAEKDFEYMKSFQTTVLNAHREKTKLKSKIKNLIGIKKKIETEETKLSDAAKKKTELLGQLKLREEQGLKTLQGLRSEHPELESLLQTGFYEKRGHLEEPVTQARLSSTYGTYVDKTYHYRLLKKGWQYEAKGESVHTVYDGSVVYAGRLPGFSKTVVVDHGDHYYSVYAWMEEVQVASGETLKEGQVVGRAGEKLYFEIRHFTDAIDPAGWIKRKMTAWSPALEDEVASQY